MRLGVTDSAPRRRVTEPLPITGCIWPSDVRGREAKKGSAAVDAFGHAPCKVSDAGRGSARLGTLRLGRTMILGTSSSGRSRRDRAHTACPARLLSRQARLRGPVQGRDLIVPRKAATRITPTRRNTPAAVSILASPTPAYSSTPEITATMIATTAPCNINDLWPNAPGRASPLVPTTNPGAPTQGVASTLGRTVGSV